MNFPFEVFKRQKKFEKNDLRTKIVTDLESAVLIYHKTNKKLQFYFFRKNAKYIARLVF